VRRVFDASALISILASTGPSSSWAEEQFSARDVVAPQIVLVEVVNVLRRHVLSGRISEPAGRAAISNLLDMKIELYPFAGFASRIWQLKSQVSSYDAWYVALAEELDVDLVTLDRRLSRAHSLKCRVLVPPE